MKDSQWSPVTCGWKDASHDHCRTAGSKTRKSSVAKSPARSRKDLAVPSNSGQLENAFSWRYGPTTTWKSQEEPRGTLKQARETVRNQR